MGHSWNAEYVIEEYSKLYAIESDLEKANAPPETILAVRKEKLLPILQELRDKMNNWALKFRPAGNFGKAIKYFLNEYEKLIIYIEFYTLVRIANLNGWDPYLFLHNLFLEIEKIEGGIDLVEFISNYR